MDNLKFNKGIFTLSLDTELAWGIIDKPFLLNKNKEYYFKTRNVIKEIINLLETYNISATWALVGSLFLSENELNIPFKKEDKSLWYGRDILNWILDCNVDQEIGCHSFFHKLFSNENINEEIKRSIKEAKKWNLELRSFVFPRNLKGHLNELKSYGFNSFRGVEQTWYVNYPKGLKKICHIIDQSFYITPPINLLEVECGLINIKGSMLYLPMNGFRKYIPLKSRIKKAYKGIDRCIEKKGIFHLWFHPFNIATNEEKLLFGLESIFQRVDEERKKGNLVIKNMGDIANMYEEVLGSKNV
ncbi:MAG: hypothetical protein FH751_16260 [Firmicutes bacterium]|nr:hypothetical protein [Bacillota bacterium]